MNRIVSSSKTAAVDQPDWFAALQALLQSVRYGSVEITIHEGRVVRLERTERVRIDTAGDADDTRRRV